MNKPYLIFILIILFFFTSACKKGEYIDIRQEFSYISITPLGDAVNPKSVTIDGNRYSSIPFLTPFEEKDSIELTLEFVDSKKNFKKKIENKKGNNEILIYYNNLQDSILTIGPHPLDGVKVPEGYVAVKFMGSSSRFSGTDGKINLAVYDVIGEIVTGQEVNYSAKPVDTISNITNTFPDDFIFIKRPQKATRFKFLDSNFKDVLVNGFRVYAFVGFETDKSVFLMKISEGGSLRFRNDLNSGLPNSDGGYNMRSTMSIYMSK